MTDAFGPTLQRSDPPLDSGAWLLRVEAADALDDAGLKAIVAVVDLLVTAGARGAFAVPGVAPALSTLRVERARVEAPNVLSFELLAQACDARAFQLLRHMCRRLRRHKLNVRAVTLTAPATAGQMRFVPEIGDDTEFDAYPARSTHLRFRTGREPVDGRRLRRAVVDLHTRVTQAHVTRLNEWLAPWFGLLEAGAYAAPLGPADEVDCVAGVVTLYDEQAVELCVNRFQASECAWHALLNMLDACWPDERLIASVEID